MDKTQLMQMANKATQFQKNGVLIIRSDMFEPQVKNSEEWQSTSPDVKPRDLPTPQKNNSQTMHQRRDPPHVDKQMLSLTQSE
jgi:hypothetical protein